MTSFVSNGFSSDAYVAAQKDAILERLSHFDGKLYIEVGGKFLYDGHASRVLPGFDPTCKLKLFQAVNKEHHRRQRLNSSGEGLTEEDDDLEIILCINAKDIVERRVWSGDKTYTESLFDTLLAYEEAGIKRKPLISANLCSRNPSPAESEMLATLEKSLTERGCKMFRRYLQPGYPNNTQLVVSDQGYGADDYITVRPGGITLVTALGSSCGKLSTCLGQIYMDSRRNIISGYCKYELFPIHNLPLDHPINCAYEAATADIHDRNLVDHWHLEAYGISAINYNRDVEAWPILAALVDAVVKKSAEISGDSGGANWMSGYRSPTDMGVNMAAQGIVSDAICCRAAIVEIHRRIAEYEDLVPAAPTAESSQEDRSFYAEKISVVTECREVLTKAERYAIPAVDDVRPVLSPTK